MCCPTLTELTPPPPGKTGWPWTEESPRLPETMPDGSPWPRISIVTPNYNYGQYLEETIRSVLLQGYLNLEYIIIDGGSNDGSLDIIRRYEKWLSYWESGKDNGQSEAINRGFGYSTGQILAWLNSDDFYICGALKQVSMSFANNSCDLVSGKQILVDTVSRPIQVSESLYPPSATHMLVRGKSGVSQPATFWTRTCWHSFGPLDTSLYYIMDYAFFLRCALGDAHWGSIDGTIAAFRFHSLQKTRDLSQREIERRGVVDRLYSCGERWNDEIAYAFERAIRYEGWFRYWMARYHLKERRVPKRIWKMLAVFVNWRCLCIKQYYPHRFQWLIDLFGGC